MYKSARFRSECGVLANVIKPPLIFVKSVGSVGVAYDLWGLGICVQFGF